MIIKNFFQALFIKESYSCKSATLKKRIILLILLLLSIFINFLPLYCSINYLGKIITTEGLILTIVGILQLEISGVFDNIFKIIEECSNTEYSTPSYITRGLISDSETVSISNKIEAILFFDRRLGVSCLIVGSLLQLVGLWV